MRLCVDTPHGPVDLDDARLAEDQARAAAPPQVAGAPSGARRAYAALHVVMRPEYAAVDHRVERPGAPDEIAPFVDWEGTLALRREADRLGFGVAEAMDTAQRFFLGHRNALDLVAGTSALGLVNGFVAGAGAEPAELGELAELAGPDAGCGGLVEAIVRQATFIHARGGVPMILPVPWLARTRQPEARYVAFYGALFERLEGPLLLHWLGAMFLPELAGYFPGDSFRKIMALDPDKVRGAKLSLLDRRLEEELRRELLPRRQVILTGDDLHFAGLIRGGPSGGAPAAVTGSTAIGGHRFALGDFSHALLGVLDAVLVPAALALRFLERGDVAAYDRLMAPCERLGRKLFAAPARHYKAGLAFLAWLDGRQDNRMLVNHEERCRGRAHYIEVARRAAQAGALRDARLAAERLRQFLAEKDVAP